MWEGLNSVYEGPNFKHGLAYGLLTFQYRTPCFQNGAKSGFETKCWGQNTSRIQNKEVYATLYLQVLCHANHGVRFYGQHPKVGAFLV